jgi:hypothetical protein
MDRNLKKFGETQESPKMRFEFGISRAFENLTILNQEIDEKIKTRKSSNS